MKFKELYEAVLCFHEHVAESDNIETNIDHIECTLDGVKAYIKSDKDFDDNYDFE